MDYSSLATRAKQLISGNGTKCVLVNPSTEDKIYNPDTNRYEGTEPERYNGYCIISQYADKLIDGTAIKVGDRKIIAVIEGGGEPIPSLSTLEVYDKAGTVLKDTYKVINGGAISPDAETVIVHSLQCRK